MNEDETITFIILSYIYSVICLTIGVFTYGTAGIVSAIATSLGILFISMLLVWAFRETAYRWRDANDFEGVEK